jgi:hypothetical protein
MWGAAAALTLSGVAPLDEVAMRSNTARLWQPVFSFAGLSRPWRTENTDVQ